MLAARYCPGALAFGFAIEVLLHLPAVLHYGKPLDRMFVAYYYDT